MLLRPSLSKACMSVGHHPAHPKEDHLPELEQLEREPWFIAARKQRPRLDHATQVPYVGSSTKGLSLILVDTGCYPTLKRLGLLPGLFEHEWVEGILEAHGYEYHGAHDFAEAAEHRCYRRDGINPQWAEAQYKPLEREARLQVLTNVHPQINLKPYKADGDRALIRRMQDAMHGQQEAA